MVTSELHSKVFIQASLETEGGQLVNRHYINMSIVNEEQKLFSFIDKKVLLKLIAIYVLQ